MSPTTALLLIGGYFALLFFISFLTSGKGDSHTFFSANRQSPWYLVAFGMIGTSLSGVTFISVPGDVLNSSFSYLGIVMGYLLGYLVIATVLMPLYYRLNLVSIYTFIEQRLGTSAYKTAAAFFLLSRSVGSAARFYLVLGVLQLAVFDAFGIPFWLSVLAGVGLIWLYTFRGGMKTIIVTDTLQTFFMLAAVGLSLYLVADALSVLFSDLVSQTWTGKYSQVFFWDWTSKVNFWKQLVAGAFIAIVMTGLDQDMMQKNLTCRNLGEAQKNMFWFSVTMFVVNSMFLTLGAALYLYAEAKGVTLPAKTDQLFPLLARDYFSPIAYIAFIMGIIAATYASTDSALTALTTSFCIDILNFNKRDNEAEKGRLRLWVHVGFSLLLVIIVLMFRWLNQESLITAIFKLAALTYGPLLGLFGFGLLTKYRVRRLAVPFICVASPLICYLMRENSAAWFGGYQFGYELLLFNGALVFGLLWMVRLPAAIDGAVQPTDS